MPTSVTRDLLEDGTYPDPSPAEAAARLFCDAARDLPASCDVLEAFSDANARIARLNRCLGLDDPSRVFHDDAAGAVAAVAQLRAEAITWGYVGDAGVALLAGDGELLCATPDDVEHARQHFPSASLPARRKREVIRGELRNSATSTPGTYGVLTGEDAALRYVRHGTWSYDDVAACAAFSDGFRPLLQDGSIRVALVAALDGRASEHEFAETCGAVRQSGVPGSGEEASVVARIVRAHRRHESD